MVEMHHWRVKTTTAEAAYIRKPRFAPLELYGGTAVSSVSLTGRIGIRLAMTTVDLRILSAGSPE